MMNNKKYFFNFRKDVHPVKDLFYIFRMELNMRCELDERDSQRQIEEGALPKSDLY